MYYGNSNAILTYEEKCFRAGPSNIYTQALYILNISLTCQYVYTCSMAVNIFEVSVSVKPDCTVISKNNYAGKI